LRGIGPSLISYYGYVNSFIDGSCRRPNSVTRFRKREVNNNSEFSCFLLSPATLHDFPYRVFAPCQSSQSFYTKCLLPLAVTCSRLWPQSQYQSLGLSALYLPTRLLCPSLNFWVLQLGFLRRPSLRPPGHWLTSCVSGAPSLPPAALRPPASLINRTPRSADTAEGPPPRPHQVGREVIS
jgi:hypothetical protein